MLTTHEIEMHLERLEDLAVRRSRLLAQAKVCEATDPLRAEQCDAWIDAVEYEAEQIKGDILATHGCSELHDAIARGEMPL